MKLVQLEPTCLLKLNSIYFFTIFVHGLNFWASDRSAVFYRSHFIVHAKKCHPDLTGKTACAKKVLPLRRRLSLRNCSPRYLSHTTATAATTRWLT